MTEEYEDLYSDEGIYGDFTYGCPCVSKSFIHSVHVISGGAFTIASNAKILCIGAGNGYEIAMFRDMGFECYGIDLFVPDVKVVKEVSTRADASKMPFRDQEFDLVFCCETFEHIPEEICFEIIAEVKRVSRSFYFTIATTTDPPYNAHINVHPPWWWMEKFNEHGLIILHAEAAPILPFVYDGHRITKLVYIDGVSMHGMCNPKK